MTLTRIGWILLGGAACALPALAQGQLRARVVVGGLQQPVAMIQDPTNPNVRFVLQKTGRIRVIVDETLQASDFLDLSAIVSTNNERGLLGMAFDPLTAKNRRFYLNYTDLNGTTRIVRYLRSANNPLVADPGSGSPVLSIEQPFANHNGGTIRFGPDGFLYIGMGDGGDANDPGNRAQTIEGMLLGKMLRIDVTGDDFPADPARNYRIPAANPFVGEAGDDEIWSLGLRNPWKFSFDDPGKLGTGAMLIGDVGQNQWEEVDHEPPLAGGRNYGWRVREGFVATGLTGGGNSIPFTDPIYAYPRSVGQSVTGGYVYRGTRLGDRFGRYFFADFVAGKVFSLALTIDPGTGEAIASDWIDHTVDLGIGGFNISSLDVDAEGELYIVDFGGRILKILPENDAWMTDLSFRWPSTSTGGLRHLLQLDGHQMSFEPQLQFESTEENNASLLVGFETDLAALSQLDFEVAMRMNLGGGKLAVAFFNWSTGRFEDVAGFDSALTLASYTGTQIAAAQYRRSDGRILMEIRSWRPNPLPFDPLLTFVDKVKITVR